MKDIIDSFDKNRPVLLLDADEVLLKFVETLEQHLLNNGFELRLTSFQITGNVYHYESDILAEPKKVQQLIGSFFDACVDDVPIVDGASDALNILSNHYQIAILTNVPSHCRSRREASLKKQGLNFPVIANKGNKGPTVKLFTDYTSKQTVFVDDLPPQHKSVAEASPDTHRVHFVADERLRPMLPHTEYSHTRIDTWPELHKYLEELIGV